MNVRTGWSIGVGPVWGGLLLLAAGAVWAQPAGVGPRLPQRDLPAAPVTSKDGSVVVGAPLSKMGYRAPVLVFVDRTRGELARATRMKFGSPSCPLVIQIGGKSDGDTRVFAARVADPDGGGVRERIELPDPEAADLGKFRRAICVALLRAWMAEAGGTRETVKDVPVWLIDGLVRHMGRETRQQDVDRTLLLWSRACLPPAAELFAAESAASREPALAAVLAGWFLEKRSDDGNPFEALLSGAAKGCDWSPSVAGRLLAGTGDPAAFDGALDLWLEGLGRTVVKPGLTSEGILRRFRSRLLLYPAFYGTTWGNNRPCITFYEAIPRADEPEVRRCAAAQKGLVKVAAAGRDGMLLATSEAYVGFLEALARGAKQGELSRLLREAEGMRKELERRTAKGVILRQTTGE
ncbi:MAG: hypothetical protein PHV28_06225 [Kiritimatiellae bacterium]|nr:hypothetical protein [Kiritimatiellia bacterium]